MNQLKKTVYLKVQDVVDKLQKLNCTLVGNRDDAWIMELLFEPGFHRYNLIEWILSKFEFDVGKISGPENSSEERMKNLESAISDLGICRQSNQNLIKGIASIEDQLKFWCLLVDILWMKYDITSSLSASETDDEGVALSLEKTKKRSISEEHEDICSCVTQICDSVNMKHLFKYDLQLLAPDVEREAEQLSPSTLEMYQIQSLQDLKENAKEKNIYAGQDIYKNALSQKRITPEENVNELSFENELNELENEMTVITQNLQKCAQGSFSDVCNDLKPLVMHAAHEDFVDVGPAFKKVEPLLESVLVLRKSLPKLESLNSKLLNISSDLDDLISQQKEMDSKFVNISELLKEEI